MSESHSSTETSVSMFHPCQIVCLEHQEIQVYGEVVQLVPDRGTCWVRPLVMIVRDLTRALAATADEHAQWYDLREGSDLLCPTVLFRPALDVELLPVLSQLYAAKDAMRPMALKAPVPGELNRLLQRLWRERPEVFE